MGSIDAVAKAKGEIIEGLMDDGLQIINADDQFCTFWQELAEGKRQVTFGLNENADIYATYQANAKGSVMQVFGIYGDFEVTLNVLGEHNVRNALAVIAATIEMGASISDVQQGLMNYQPITNRGGVHSFNSMLLIDDSYNANPISMQAAFDSLTLFADDLKRKHAQVKTIIVLGSMAELGQQAKSLHQGVGLSAKNAADDLYCTGTFAKEYQQGFGDSAHDFDDRQSLLQALLASIESNSAFHLVLVKGSRSAGMEEIVKALIEKQENTSDLEPGA